MDPSANLHDVLYYQPKIKNFGDHLNEFLIESLDLKKIEFPVLGIGSILTKDFLECQIGADQKIFTLGSGCRSASTDIDNAFIDGSFVRGPLSARALQNRVPFISDGAYLLRITNLFEKLIQTPKKYKISIVPYFRSYSFVDWTKFETETGIHVIHPSIPNGIVHTLNEIAQSENIIAEAMHGAIVADIFRIPWVKLDFLASSFESKAVNTFKWKDWQGSLELPNCNSIDTHTYHALISTTKHYRFKNAYLALLKRFNNRRLRRSIESFLQNPFYYLSDDLKVKSVDQELKKSIQILRNDKK